MATRTSKEPSGSALAEAKEKSVEVASKAREEVEARTVELRSDATFQIKDQIDYRSSQAGEQVRAVGEALHSSVEQLRSEGKASSADVMDKVAQRADDLGAYLASADADLILSDVESFVRRRPWLAAGAAALAGFAASRFVKASSDRRYELAR